MAFENYTEYSYSNFSSLNQRVSDSKEQKKYIDSWKNKYADYFKKHPPEESFLWNIRVHKSLKEVFSSSAMYQESLVAKESRCWASFYFLSYYSLFHAFLACVYMLPNESLDNLSEITHSKLVNVFNSTFCSGRPQIIDESVCEVFSILKYLREYYSYHMPPNHFLYEHKDNIKPDIVLPDCLKPCFQLASLLSEIVESAFIKYHKKISNKIKYFQFVRDNFYLVNCRKHPITNQYLIDYVDKVRLKETFEYPGPVPFVIELEHFSDEFGLYEGAEFPRFLDGAEISPSRFVYEAIM
ncbi:hypothetical protein Psch_02630 [Pelotomaculum schinkii]|uniref:Uncharacterized protein n=1 Tax=Pelotomaculum schinkii TaxID=78350 RepID=A0A4Y7RA55_9FIRM|nr:hypothetical protein [Pelotomaculum schinkii]TEB05589.1 hypothetical protein Psch_02630 [Pelotomaculum schinkii]